VLSAALSVKCSMLACIHDHGHVARTRPDFILGGCSSHVRSSSSHVAMFANLTLTLQYHRMIFANLTLTFE
jgi:hypothetical protein